MIKIGYYPGGKSCSTIVKKKYVIEVLHRVVF